MTNQPAGGLFHQVVETIEAPASRRRSLIGDLAKALDLYMRYWGMDARGGERSVLVAAGMQRIEREISTGEGSSRYRQAWEGGWIELHSFCAGFYHVSKKGIIFSRAERRIFSASQGGVAIPEVHRQHNAGSPPDVVLQALPPFIRWILDYEARVASTCQANYRSQCWRKLGASRFGPHPKKVIEWLETFLHKPEQLDRWRQLTLKMDRGSNTQKEPHENS